MQRGVIGFLFLGANLGVADESATLVGKVMCGYQGWFNAEGDGADCGNRHWAKRSGPLTSTNVKVDRWPDLSEYGPAERFATPLLHADGRPAEVFSSFHPQTVRRHFRWMQDYGVDGAFVQRFIASLRDPKIRAHHDAVLEHCRRSAKEFGRSFVVMYDLSGLDADRMNELIDDWRRLWPTLIDATGYQWHRGKPLVAVWGVGFNDGRKYTVDECRQLVDQLHADGCSVMLGVPAFWRELKRDAVADPALLDLLAKVEVISPWTVGRYRSPAEARRHATTTLTQDLEWCRQRSIDYLPVVFPGFSWFNMTGKAFNEIPRQGGEFYWSQFVADNKAGAQMFYVAMFDEVDEGTAIFKCSNDPPQGDGLRFLTDEGLPSDHYLWLTGEGRRLLRGQRPLTDELPTRLP